MNLSHRIVVAACGVLMAASLAGCDRFRSAESFYERGQQQHEKGNFRAALGDYRSAVDRDGTHGPARLAMARVMYFLGDFEGALTAVEFGIKGGLGADAVKLRYEILTSLSRFEDILKTVATEATLSDAEKALISARAQGGLGHSEEAYAQLSKSLQLDPRNVPARTLMALFIRERGNVAEAEKALDQLVAENDSDAEVRFARGRLALSVGDLKLAKASLEAAEQFGRKTLNWPTQAQVYALLTEVAIAERDHEAATKYLGGFQNRTGSNAIASYLSARVSLLKNDVDGAVAELQKSVARVEYPPSQLLLASLQLSRANYGAAETLLGTLMAKNPHNVEVRKLVAQLYLATNRAADARKLLGSETPSGAPDEKTDSQLAWLQGQTLIATGAQEAGVELLEKAFAANPKDVAKGVQLARLYLLLGRAEKAKALLETLPGPADAQRQSLVVLANISGKNREEAKKQIDSLIARNPKDTNLHVAAGAILTRLGDASNGMRLFKDAIELDAKNTEAKLALASVLAATRQLDAADEQLRGVVALDARNAAAYVGLANTAFARGNQPEAMKFLEQAIGADPGVIQPRLQLAMLALRAQDTERAKGLLDQAITVGNNRHEIINTAGTILQQAQRYDDALILFDRAGAAGNEEAPFRAAQVQVALGRKEDARRRLSALAAGGGKLQLAAITSLAALDVEDGKVDAGVARLNPLRTRKELVPQLDEIEGDLYFQAKNVAKAQAAYDRAIGARPSQRLTVKRFRLLAGTDPSAAVQGLQAWLKNAPKDNLVRKELGLYYVQKEMNEKALVEFETLHREGGASDPEVLNNFAWLLGNKKDPRALGLARDAYRLDPSRPEIGDTYGWLLLDANNVKEALQVLEKAAAAAANSQEIQYHYAVAQARDGNQAKAKALLQSILNTKAKFAQRDEAERLLKSLN